MHLPLDCACRCRYDFLPTSSVIAESFPRLDKILESSLDTKREATNTHTMAQLRPPGAAMPFPPPRRHSTVPTTFQPEPPRTVPKESTAGSVETLFNHPSVKIIAFSAGKSAFDRIGSSQGDIPGSLQPSSPFERVIAIGMSLCCATPACYKRSLLIPFPIIQAVFRSTEPLAPLPSSVRDQPCNPFFPRASAGALTNSPASLCYKSDDPITGG